MNNFTIPFSSSQPISDQTKAFNREWFIYLQNLLTAVGEGVVGTTTQVLHGGGAGYSPINLTNDVSQVLPGVNGGTGVSNALKSITLGGNLTTSGSSIIFSVTAASSVVVPTTGTLLVQANIGTIATQNSNNVTVTGGTITNVTVNAINLITVSSFRIDNQVSTGAQTATFVATNKPGAGTTSPDKWLVVNLDGTNHYIPCFL